MPARLLSIDDVPYAESFQVKSSSRIRPISNGRESSVQPSEDQEAQCGQSHSNESSSSIESKMRKAYLEEKVERSTDGPKVARRAVSNPARRRHATRDKKRPGTKRTIKQSPKKSVNFAPVDRDGSYERLGWDPNNPGGSSTPKGSALKKYLSSDASIGDNTTTSAGTQSLTLAESTEPSIHSAPDARTVQNNHLLVSFPETEGVQGPSPRNRNKVIKGRDQEQKRNQCHKKKGSKLFEPFPEQKITSEVSKSTSNKPTRPNVYNFFDWTSSATLKRTTSIKEGLAAERGVSNAKKTQPSRQQRKMSTHSTVSSERSFVQPSRQLRKQSTHSSGSLELSKLQLEEAINDIASELANTASSFCQEAVDNDSTKTESTTSVERRPRKLSDDDDEVSKLTQDMVQTNKTYLVQGYDSAFLLEDPFGLIDDMSNEKQEANISDKAIWHGLVVNFIDDMSNEKQEANISDKAIWHGLPAYQEC